MTAHSFSIRGMRVVIGRAYSRAGFSVAVLLCASTLYFAGVQTSVSAALEELNNGNVFEAIHKLKLTLQDNPLPQAYFYLSGIYTRMGRYDTAYRFLSSALANNPAQATYYEQLGLIRRYAGCRT